MFPRIFWSALFAVVAGAGLAGCARQKTIENVSTGGLRRPPELDQLEVFVGRWEVAGEVKLAGRAQTANFSGSNEVHWEGDGRYLVARGVTCMAGLRETHGMAAWTYDARGRMFRSVLVSGTGDVALGTAWHDEKTDTWHGRIVGRGPSGKLIWKGRIRFIDRDTKKEHWAGYTAGGLVKKVEISKTERRR